MRPTQQQLDKAKELAKKRFLEHFEGHSEEGLVEAWGDNFTEMYPELDTSEDDLTEQQISEREAIIEELEKECDKWRKLISNKVDELLKGL